jgi:protocatechuate 3,4-dioxygenase beta subunit
VTDVDGEPLANANLDIWQADAEGRYSGFMPGPPTGNLRGQVRTRWSPNCLSTRAITFTTTSPAPSSPS